VQAPYKSSMRFQISLYLSAEPLARSLVDCLTYRIEKVSSQSATFCDACHVIRHCRSGHNPSRAVALQPTQRVVQRRLGGSRHRQQHGARPRQSCRAVRRASCLRPARSWLTVQPRSAALQQLHRHPPRWQLRRHISAHSHDNRALLQPGTLSTQVRSQHNLSSG